MRLPFNIDWRQGNTLKNTTLMIALNNDDYTNNVENNYWFGDILILNINIYICTQMLS